MSPKTTQPQLKSTPSAEYLKKSPAEGTKIDPAKNWFWALLLVGIVLTVAVIGLAVYKIIAAPKSVTPPPERRIAVPFKDNSALWAKYQSWVVQEDGRIKPFDSFAREIVRTITGREKFEGNHPVPVVISWIMLFDKNIHESVKASRKLNCEWENYPFILCDYHNLRKLLYAEKRGGTQQLSEEDLHGKYVEPSTLRNSKVFKRIISDANDKEMANSKAVLTGLEQKAREVKKRFALYERVRQGGQDAMAQVRAQGAFTVVALDKHCPTWFSLRAIREMQASEQLWKQTIQGRRLQSPKNYEGTEAQSMPEDDLRALSAVTLAAQDAYKAGNEQDFQTHSETMFAKFDEVSNKYHAYPGTTTTGLELWFHQSNPFRKAWIFSLLSTLLLVGSLATKWRWAKIGTVTYYGGLVVLLVALVWSAIGFYCRITISGRPPVSNMYESVIWVGFMTGVFGLILELIYRKGVIALSGALVSMFGLMLADQLPMVFSPAIQPLQAVLRSNYWLLIHVITIVSSYAAFALAWGLGNINLGLMLFAPERRDLVKTLSNFCYRAVQLGVVLLAAGTLLGGFWAAESWGRFWGWDPKEVWALIALLCYIIPLHARYVGWVKDFGLAVCSVVCFSSVVMAWYGVNFILGAGLHSYGFGSGNDFWVYWAGLFNIMLVVHACLRYRYKRGLSNA